MKNKSFYQRGVMNVRMVVMVILGGAALLSFDLALARKWVCKDWHDGDYFVEADSKEQALKKCPQSYYGGLGEEVK